MSGEDNKAVHLHCKAHKNTWSHQRRKKRLLQRLKSKELQAQPGTSLALQAYINITLTIHFTHFVLFGCKFKLQRHLVSSPDVNKNDVCHAQKFKG